jgi:hypothetical protein
MDTQLDRPIVIAVFDDRHAARAAVAELESSGFNHHDVGFAIRGDDAVQGGMITDAEGTKDGTGALRGVTGGAVVGGLVGAAVGVLLPGVGPVLLGGVLAAAAGGAAAGAATGGLLGAMSGLDLSEHEATYYTRQFNEGKAIVTVHANGRGEFVVEVLKRHGGYDLTSRANDPLADAEGDQASRAYETLI